MTDDDAGPAPARADGEALLYDYFKHLTSLCLLSLGGVVALADKVEQRPLLIAILAVIGLAAILSFSGTGDIVRSRYTGKPLKKGIAFNHSAAPFLLSIGLGMFLYIFIETL